MKSGKWFNYVKFQLKLNFENASIFHNFFFLLVMADLFCFLMLFYDFVFLLFFIVVGEKRVVSIKHFLNTYSYTWIIIKQFLLLMCDDLEKFRKWHSLLVIKNTKKIATVLRVSSFHVEYIFMQILFINKIRSKHI